MAFGAIVCGVTFQDGLVVGAASHFIISLAVKTSCLWVIF